eukprot:3845699-Prorocentrum_lima.AAC.1
MARELRTARVPQLEAAAATHSCTLLLALVVRVLTAACRARIRLPERARALLVAWARLPLAPET